MAFVTVFALFTFLFAFCGVSLKKCSPSTQSDARVNMDSCVCWSNTSFQPHCPALRCYLLADKRSSLYVTANTSHKPPDASPVTNCLHYIPFHSLRIGCTANSGWCMYSGLWDRILVVVVLAEQIYLGAPRPTKGSFFPTTTTTTECSSPRWWHHIGEEHSFLWCSLKSGEKQSQPFEISPLSIVLVITFITTLKIYLIKSLFFFVFNWHPKTSKICLGIFVKRNFMNFVHSLNCAYSIFNWQK